MRVKEGFVLREIADSIVVVPTGELLKEYRGMITLNESAKFIWELLQKDISKEDLVAKFAEEYHLDLEKAEVDAEKFLQTLKENKVLMD